MRKICIWIVCALTASVTPGVAPGKENVGSPPVCAALTAYEDPASGLMGYVDVANATVIAPRFPMAWDFTEHGVAFAVLPGAEAGWALIDCNATLILRPHVVDNGPDCFREGLARFVEDGRYGFFDQAGGVAIPAQFDYARPFENGRAAVCTGCQRVKDGEYTRLTGGQWSWVDREGGPASPSK